MALNVYLLKAVARSEDLSSFLYQFWESSLGIRSLFLFTRANLCLFCSLELETPKRDMGMFLTPSMSFPKDRMRLLNSQLKIKLQNEALKLFSK